MEFEVDKLQRELEETNDVTRQLTQRQQDLEMELSALENNYKYYSELAATYKSEGMGALIKSLGNACKTLCDCIEIAEREFSEEILILPSEQMLNSLFTKEALRASGIGLKSKDGRYMHDVCSLY